ncbi:hypothetical protein D9611_003839 [Ephemerocybe angulata]|uniref:Uncharacterized protein n=1 Tax=Ephemerocybe angulata TaxID=980116 RepID=A0A8H5B5F5_9AGAR|nr:hypothetical protein D9611_003839 [Tulosesus angulatus]
MVKPAKKVPAKGEQSITNWFQRVPAASQGSTVSDTASTRTRSKAAATAASPLTQPASTPRKTPVSALTSSNASNVRADVSTPKLRASPRKPADSQRLKQTRSSSLKRARSPDAVKSSAAEKKRVESKPAQSSQAGLTTPRKKARMSSPYEASQGSTSSLVPSSQSDEEELSSPSSNVSRLAGRESPKTWRKQGLPPTPHSTDGSEPMEVDEEPLTEPSTPGNGFETTGSFSASSHVLTPPYTDRASDDIPAIPPTPVALDPAAKTALVIEQIKARAMAAAKSLHESKEHEMDIAVPDVLDDSDDEDFPTLFQVKNAKALSAAPEPQVRRSTRQRTSLGASSTGSPTLRRSPRLSLSPPTGPSPPTRKPRKAVNPIQQLIREQTQAEKKGRGSAALLRAESSLGRRLLLEEMSLEDEDEELDDDEVENQPRNLFLTEKDGEDLFGSDKEAGNEINGILREDLEAKAVEERLAEKLQYGVPLWATGTEDSMAIDEQSFVPIFASAGNSGTLHMLGQAMQNQDFARATLILKSGALSKLTAADQPEIMSDLCILDSPLSGVAFAVALDLLDPSPSNRMKCPVPSRFVIRSLLELGAAPERLQSNCLEFEHRGPFARTDASTREAVLYRLVALVTRAARRLVAEEIPDLVLALISLGMDSTTSSDLRREVMVALDGVCRAVCPINGFDRKAESVVAARLSALAEGYQPVNKAALLSLLSGGNGATLRIARFVAYSIIVRYSPSSITEKSYCDPAPFSGLLNQLLQPRKGAKSQTLFAVTDATDYTEMKFYISILAVATSNIKAYVDLEGARLLKPSGLLTSEAPKGDGDLQLFHSLLEDIHTRINDLRAAHMDRSRAKAAIKQLQMRVHYQRMNFERQYKAKHGPKAIFSTFLLQHFLRTSVH